MSRQGRVFQPRWGLTILRQKPIERYTASDKIAYLNRVIKRANQAAGYDTAKKQVIKWNYTVELDTSYSGSVEARTRSEARAKVKSTLGIKKRLPVGTKLEKADV
jgi:hypothetical protein